MIKFTQKELEVIEEMIGGRYDSLKEMLIDYPHMSNKADLERDIKFLEPLVIKIRGMLE